MELEALCELSEFFVFLLLHFFKRSSLYDELCFDKIDKFIATTTVFPYFINTRMELSDLIDGITEYWPRISPEDAADQIVRAVLANKRSLVIPKKLSTVGFVK